MCVPCAQLAVYTRRRAHHGPGDSHSFSPRDWTVTSKFFEMVLTSGAPPAEDAGDSLPRSRRCAAASTPAQYAGGLGCEQTAGHAHARGHGHAWREPGSRRGTAGRQARKHRPRGRHAVRIGDRRAMAAADRSQHSQSAGHHPRRIPPSEPTSRSVATATRALPYQPAAPRHTYPGRDEDPGHATPAPPPAVRPGEHAGDRGHRARRCQLHQPPHSARARPSCHHAAPTPPGVTAHPARHAQPAPHGNGPVPSRLGRGPRAPGRCPHAVLPSGR